MISPLWSVLLAGGGLAVLWLAGNERQLTRQLAWVVGLLLQALWLIYALVTDQWAFAVSAVAYAFVHGRNLRCARRRRQNAEDSR